jgi:hypothetical protein
MSWLDRLPLAPLVVGALLLGLAPFAPEPHLVEKLRMLFAGALVRPIDIFDLLLHGSLPLLLVLKLAHRARSPGR